MKINNKKAESSKLLTPFWYIAIGIIGIGIVIGVYIFYSISYDIRPEEAKSLVNRLYYSISNNGYIDSDVLKSDFDIFKKANIDPTLFNEGIFYLNIKIYHNSDLIKQIVNGSEDFEIQCGLKGKDFAKCYKKEFFLLDSFDNSKKYKIFIYAGSNQKGGKV